MRRRGGGGRLQCCSFSGYREGVLQGLALPPSKVFALSFSFCFRCFFAIRSSPCISLLLRCPVLPSLLLFSFYCHSLPLYPTSFSYSAISFWPRSPYVCVSVSWLFAFALSPLLLALFCCLHCGVSDIGFLAFASTQSLRWGLLVVVAVLGVRAVWLWGSLSFLCPYPAPSFSPSSFRGFALSTAVAYLYAIGVLAPSHLFAAAFFCLFGFGCRFFSSLSSSFCRALLLFFRCSFTTLLGFSALVLGRSLTSSVTLRFSFLLLVVLGLSPMVPFSTGFSFVLVVLLRLLIRWCFLLRGFPRCTSSWLSCGYSFVRFLAFSVPVPLVLGFSCWSLGALLPRSNLRFPPRQGRPLGRGGYLLGFSELLLLPCHVHAFLVPLHWLFSASLLLFLLSCSPLPVGLSSRGSVILLFRRRFWSWYFLRPFVVFLKVV